jgi:hypothetical protein
MAKEKKLNEAEKKAKEAGFKIGKRSPKLGTKAHQAKASASSFMKEMEKRNKK